MQFLCSTFFPLKYQEKLDFTIIVLYFKCKANQAVLKSLSEFLGCHVTLVYLKRNLKFLISIIFQSIFLNSSIFLNYIERKTSPRKIVVNRFKPALIDFIDESLIT